MAKLPNQLVDDRVIPLSPALALFMGYLPGIDDRDARNKSKPRTRRRDKGITSSQRGINRALVLTQINHRLKDSAPTDRRLFARAGVPWYARTYREWHTWDFPFMAYATMVKTFQDLIDAGYLLARLEREIAQPDELITDRRALLRVMGVYNGKCFTIDAARLAADMAADERIAAYYAVMFPNRSMPEDEAATSDQPDLDPPKVGSTSDQVDQTPEIRLIRPSDQVDQTPEIRLIRPPDQPDQRSSAVKSAGDQQVAGVSSSSEPPALPAPGGGDPAETDPPRQVSHKLLDRVQQFEYQRLTTLGVHPDKAFIYAAERDPAQIIAWANYITEANRPGSKLKPITNTGGFISKMLDNPSNYPRLPAKKESNADYWRRISKEPPEGWDIQH